MNFGNLKTELEDEIMRQRSELGTLQMQLQDARQVSTSYRQERDTARESVHTLELELRYQSQEYRRMGLRYWLMYDSNIAIMEKLVVIQSSAKHRFDEVTGTPLKAIPDMTPDERQIYDRLVITLNALQLITIWSDEAFESMRRLREAFDKSSESPS